MNRTEQTGDAMKILAATLLMILAAGPGMDLSAQELVTNGTFDVNVDHWIVGNVVYGDIAHHTLDADGDPLSGSAAITNSFPDTDGYLATTQCIPALPTDRDYVFGATMRIGDGTVTTGHASVQIWFWEDTNCTTVVGGTAATAAVTTSATGWNQVRTTATAPASAVAARLTLWNTKDDAGGVLSIHYDNVTLQTVAIFGDDFESGNTSAWSSSSECSYCCAVTSFSCTFDAFCSNSPCFTTGDVACAMADCQP